MSYLTPAYPFDPALIDASLRDASLRDPRRTPHAPFPAVDGAPIVLGGVLRSGSPFLDLMPLDALPPAVPSGEAMLMDGMLFVPVEPEELDEQPNEAPAEPPRPAEPFDRAAVERARARAAQRIERVEATITSDDGVADHVCDVTGWLASATVREIETLIHAGWAGDEAAEVAVALADEEPEVGEVLRHARRADTGVVVEIDGAAALAWLARHRPAVAEVLDDSPDEASDEVLDAG